MCAQIVWKMLTFVVFLLFIIPALDLHSHFLSLPVQFKQKY